MDKDALIRQLMATYVDEVDDQARALNRDLLELEKTAAETPRSELYKSLLRTAHTLKGASRSVNGGLVEAVCHQLEETFAALQRGDLAATPELFALFFAVADAIEEAGRQLRRDENVEGGTLAALLSDLRALTARMQPGEKPSEADKPPESAPWQTGGEALKANASATGSAATVADAGKPSTVRVAADKLDALLARSGEFTAAYRRLLLRTDELETLSRFLGSWQAEWSAASLSIRAALQRRGIERSNVLAAPLRPVIRRLPELLKRTAENFQHLRTESSRLLAAIVADMHNLQRTADAVVENVRQARLLPFAEACLGLDRMTRDLAKETGKEVDLAVDGGSAECDRSVLEGLKDSLRHLVRNAVCHGIEPPDERRSAGKPLPGRVTISASMHGSQFEVTVADDGRGLDLAALRAVARQKQLPEPASDRDFARMIFNPGVTTAKRVTGVSGRGVGLDIVKTRAEAAHGSVDVAFEAGRGSRISVVLPLTLTSLRSLLVQAGGELFALVGTNVEWIGKIDPAELKRVKGREVLSLEQGLLPVASLAQMLGLADFGPLARGKAVPFAVIAAGDRQAVLLVDEHVAEQEVMIQSLGSRIRCVRYVSGATLLPTGKIALVLNAASLVRGVLERPLSSQHALPGDAPRKRLLLAEDSITAQTPIADILADAGYDVATAPDGMAAWQLLQESGADLVITDVAMPRMDGFALIEAVRKSNRFRELPVVLVTSCETDEVKARGAASGANAYFLKSRFDPRALLETIAQLL